MACNIVLLFAFVAATSAQYHHGGYGADYGYQQQAVAGHYGGHGGYGYADHGHGGGGYGGYGHSEAHYAPAEYEFGYAVHDEKTGDIKQQKESRHGDKVVGEYSLIEPDGHRRTVKYSADKHTGFVAEVHREAVKGYVAPAQYGHGGYGYGGHGSYQNRAGYGYGGHGYGHGYGQGYAAYGHGGPGYQNYHAAAGAHGQQGSYASVSQGGSHYSTAAHGYGGHH